MEITVGEWPIEEGDEVVTSDGHKLGKIKGFWPDIIAPTHLVVEKGFLFTRDLYVPTDAIGGLDGDRVFLTVSKKAAEVSGWDKSPDEVLKP